MSKTMGDTRSGSNADDRPTMIYFRNAFCGACRCRVSETPTDSMDSMSARIGRTSKGDRHVIVTRPQRPVADVVIREAAAAGMSISDYVAAVLAHAHGMPQYAPSPQTPNDQQELPLKTA
jgi:hypothetical protein